MQINQGLLEATANRFLLGGLTGFVDYAYMFLVSRLLFLYLTTDDLWQ